jgi:hypothetical protein
MPRRRVLLYWSTPIQVASLPPRRLGHATARRSAAAQAHRTPGRLDSVRRFSQGMDREQANSTTKAQPIEEFTRVQDDG